MKLRILFLLCVGFCTQFVFCQPNTKLVWGYNHYNKGSRPHALNFEINDAVIDHHKNSYFTIPVFDTLKLHNQIYTSKAGYNAVIVKYDSSGNLLNVIPILGGKHSCYFRLTILENDQLFIYGSVDTSIQIGSFSLNNNAGNILFIAAISKNGTPLYLKKSIQIGEAIAVTHNQCLLYHYGIFSTTWNGKNYPGNGCYVTILDSAGNSKEVFYLGSNGSGSFERFFLDQHNRLYIGANVDYTRSLTFMDSVYTRRDTAHNRTLSLADNFLFIVDSNRQSFRTLRFDTAMSGPGITGIAVDDNDNLYLSLMYFQTCKLFGKKLYVQFKGGSVPFFAVLNAKNLAIQKLVYKDTCNGGTNSAIYFKLSDDRKRINCELIWQENSRWPEIPDTVTNFITGLIYNYQYPKGYQFLYSPIASILPNPVSPFVHPVKYPISGLDLNIGGYTFKNNGGNDYFVGLIAPQHWKSSLIFKKVTLNNLSIFPNPVEDRLYLKNIPQNLKTGYKILDFQGRILQQGEIMDNRINTCNIGVGAYVLYLTGENGTLQCIKFLKGQ